MERRRVFDLCPQSVEELSDHDRYEALTCELSEDDSNMCCVNYPNFDLYGCTRYPNHSSPHVATGTGIGVGEGIAIEQVEEIYAIWPCHLEENK